MGDTWITDITHFNGVDAPESNAPAAARRLDQYLHEIVKAASFAKARFHPILTEVRCRRRPGRKPCPGRISVLIDTGDWAIHWGCTHCGDNGVIRNWKGSEWDLSELGGDEKADADDPLPLPLDDEEWTFLLRLLSGTAWEERLRRHMRDDNILWVKLSMDELNMLYNIISDTIDVASRKREIELLDGILCNIGVAIDGF
jgi:hypothetical protein